MLNFMLCTTKRENFGNASPPYLCCACKFTPAVKASASGPAAAKMKTSILREERSMMLMDDEKSGSRLQ